MDKETNTPGGQKHQGSIPLNEDLSQKNAMKEETVQESASPSLRQEHVETVVEVVEEGGDRQNEHGAESISTQREQTQEQASAKDQDAAEELARFKDQHLRLAAEFDNYKRRNVQEWQQKLKYAANGLVHELLSVLDNLEQATAAAQTALQQADHAPLRTLLAGMQMVHKQLEFALQQQGVHVLSPVGKPFDPNRHEAVGQQPDESVVAGTVLRQVQAGYLLHDRLVRPARVVIAISQSPTA